MCPQDLHFKTSHPDKLYVAKHIFSSPKKYMHKSISNALNIPNKPLGPSSGESTQINIFRIKDYSWTLRGVWDS